MLLIECPEFESQQGQKIFLSSTWSITALGPTQPRINWAMGHFGWRKSASAWPNLQLHLLFPYAPPCFGQEKLLRLSFNMDVVQLIELLKHFSTTLSAGLKKPLK